MNDTQSKTAGSEVEREADLIEKTALRVGMKSLMNHGAASCVYTEGCDGVSQEHLIAFAREVALHCVVALGPPASLASPPSGGWISVDERLPAKGFPVLACNPLGYVGRAVWDGQHWNHIGKPNYWQPMPTPPAPKFASGDKSHE